MVLADGEGLKRFAPPLACSVSNPGDLVIDLARHQFENGTRSVFYRMVGIARRPLAPDETAIQLRKLFEELKDQPIRKSFDVSNMVELIEMIAELAFDSDAPPRFVHSSNIQDFLRAIIPKLEARIQRLSRHGALSLVRRLAKCVRWRSALYDGLVRKIVHTDKVDIHRASPEEKAVFFVYASSIPGVSRQTIRECFSVFWRTRDAGLWLARRSRLVDVAAAYARNQPNDYQAFPAFFDELAALFAQVPGEFSGEDAVDLAAALRLLGRPPENQFTEALIKHVGDHFEQYSSVHLAEALVEIAHLRGRVVSRRGSSTRDLFLRAAKERNWQRGKDAVPIQTVVLLAYAYFRGGIHLRMMSRPIARRMRTVRAETMARLHPSGLCWIAAYLAGAARSGRNPYPLRPILLRFRAICNARLHRYDPASLRLLQLTSLMTMPVTAVPG